MGKILYGSHLTYAMSVSSPWPKGGQPQPRSSPPSAGIYTTHLFIGALVPPVLCGLITARLIADGFRQAGLMGEQLLQGQRLPNFHVHAQE